MPGRDQTGPFGNGPMTGRRNGVCGERTMADAEYQGFGNRRGRNFCAGFRGAGRRFAGGGFGRLRGNATNSQKDLKQEVQEEKDDQVSKTNKLDETIANIQKRINELEKQL